MNYVEHYHAERKHQGLGNELIDPGNEVGSVAGKVECYERLCGIPKYYHRQREPLNAIGTSRFG